MKESICVRLKTFRLSKKATQKDMASALGCSIITYNRYEREMNVPKTEDLALLYYMGCNINWLITGEGQMEWNERTISYSENDMFRSLTKSLEMSTDTAKIQAEAIKNFSIKPCNKIISIGNIGENSSGFAQ